METLSGDFIGHTSCPKCQSSDGRAEYSSGSSYCFSCGTYFPSDDETHEDTFEDTMGEKKEGFTPVDISPFQKTTRGIDPDIFSKYSYGYSPTGDHVENLYSSSGKIVAQKFRTKDKKFSWKGDAKNPLLFGQQLWRTGGKIITITEGEIDALSVATAFGGKYPVVSLINGAQSAKRDLKKHLEYLSSFEEIVLWFDNDEPGRAAVEEAVKLFKPGKVSVVYSPPSLKDANGVLKVKGKSGVLSLFYERKKYTPSGIVSSAALDLDTLLSETQGESYEYLYPGLNEKLHGARKGEVVVWTAGTGVGKTTAVRETAFKFLMKDKLKIGWVALEENVRQSAIDFMGLYLDARLRFPEVREGIKKEKITEAYEAVLSSGDLYFYDHWGSLDDETLMDKLRFLATGAEVDFIFLDHISIVVSGGDYKDSERQAIDRLMTNLRSLAEETGVGIHVVSHIRKSQDSKGFENGKEVQLSDLRGSGAIAQLSDGVVAYERDQQGDDSDIGTFRVLKNRFAGDTGESGNGLYVKDTGRLIPYDSLEDFPPDVAEEESKEDF